MRRLALAAGAIIVTLSLSALAREPPIALVSGTVWLDDPDGQRPAGHAVVFLSSESNSDVATRVTDADGRFAFDSVAGGLYTLRASRTGYLERSFGENEQRPLGTPLFVPRAASVSDLSLVLERGGVISGIVRDWKGDPASRAVVAASSVAGAEAIVTADDRGAFRLFGLKPGEYYVAANLRLPGRGDIHESRDGGGSLPSRTEFLPLHSPAANPDDHRVPRRDLAIPTFYPGVASAVDAVGVVVGTSEEHAGVDFNLVLAPVADVGGFVSTSDGSPAANVTVSAKIRDALFGAMPVIKLYSAVSGADGHFVLRGLVAGSYVIVAMDGLDVEARHSGLSANAEPRGSREVTVRDRDVDDADIVLQPTRRLAGSIAGVGDRATTPKEVFNVPIAFTKAVGEFDEGGAGSVFRTQAVDGRFELFDVTPGVYTTRVVPPRGWFVQSVKSSGRNLSEAAVDSRSGDVTDIVVTLAQEAGTSGQLVLPSGASVADYVVVMFPSDSSFWSGPGHRIQIAYPDDAGRFVIPGMPEGDYVLVVTAAATSAWSASAEVLRTLAAHGLPVTLRNGVPVHQDVRISP
jgi:hypothetical protein